MMKPAARTGSILAGLLLQGMLAAASHAQPASAMASGPAIADAPLQAQINAIVQLGQRQPEQALLELKQLRSETPAAMAAKAGRQFEYAEAQIRLEDGDGAATLALADTLARDPQYSAQAQLLRAMAAARQGLVNEAALAAQRSLDQLNAGCKSDEDEAGLKASWRKGCDFRSSWQALGFLVTEQEVRGATPQAISLANRALALAQVIQDPALLVTNMGVLANLYSEQDEPTEAQAWLQRARAHAGTDKMLLSHARNYEARIASREGDKAGQLRSLTESLRLAREADAPRFVAREQNNLADYYMHRGEPARSLALSREALPVVLRYKDLRSELVLRHNMAVALLQLKQIEPARKEIARVDELRRGQADTVQRIRQMRELGEAWVIAGQPKEAIRLFHLERELTAEANARNREASLQELKLKYDSSREQHDLDLLTRDRTIKDRQLGNRSLAQQVGIAVAVLLGLSLLLVGLMIKRVREANRKLKASQALLRAQSDRDPLTDLANRRCFLAVMEQQQKLEPQAKFSGALLMVDIDHFKHVNDEQGHGIGDVVICEVARRLSHAVRAEDLVVRWGGEEFLVFAPDVSQEQLGQLAARILQSVGGTVVTTEKGPLRITVSIGFAHFPLPPSHLPVHWEQAVNWADMALYVAKAQGRNRAMGIATVNAADTEALLQIEADFEAACSSNRVKMTQVMGPT